MIPIIGARSLAQAEKNLGALELQLSGEELARLDTVSRIELGFPHDFDGGRLAFGDTLELLDDHRGALAPAGA